LKNKVEVSAPGKLMLFGEHAVVYGKPCIVTAVDQRIRVRAELQRDNRLTIQAPDVGVTKYAQDMNKLGEGEVAKGARFILAAVRNFNELRKIPAGLKIETKSDFSSEFGFGSSSAVTVGIIKALDNLFKVNMTKEELFQLSYKSVLDVQGVGSGFDLAAAIWGGTIYFVGGGKEIAPVKVNRLPVVVGYTGIKADTPTVVKQVGRLYDNKQEVINSIWETMALIVTRARNALEARDDKTVGELMNINQGLLDAIGVNTPELFSLVNAARGAGAYGAKLSGAGGGDCMIAWVDDRNSGKVADAIKKAGGSVLSVDCNAGGAEVIG
jgi:mevalonate kinase